MTSPAQVVRRWGLWVLVVAVVVVALVVGSSRPGPTSLAARTRAIASEVRCPVCQGESAEQSQVPASVAIRSQIQSDLAAGMAPSAILRDLEHAYGVTILEKPPAQGIGLVVWGLPVAVAVVGAAGLAVAFARWRRRASPAAPGAGLSGPWVRNRPGGGGAGGATLLPSADDAALVAEALAASREGR